MKGFFNQELWSGTPQNELVPLCGLCGLWKHCKSPKMEPTGKGRKRILVVGEGSGVNEDLYGKQFIGKSGKLLESTLLKFGIRFRKDCWITNAIICHAKHPNGSNRTPTSKEIDYCRPNLIKTLDRLKPEIVIPLGGSAVKSLLGWLWKDDVGMISRWDGHHIPSCRLNAWVCPTWHPSYILRTEYGSQKENEVRTMFFENHLRDACELEGRPYKEVPDWKSKIKIIMDHEKAGISIRLMTKLNKPLAFDYETTMLKPDSDKAQIVSCSVSDGDTSIAFPWHGDAIKAMKVCLKNENIPKIASNLKMEDRWTRKEFGFGVRGWKWDTVLGAHVLDNRPMTKSIKFQAFVLLGVECWDGKVKPYLKAKHANDVNRIKELDLKVLLEYNALDSLYEWHVAKVQSKKLGIPL